MYKLIILTSTQRILSTILEVMDSKSIKLSGVYYLQSQYNKELAYLHNIYKDFDIKNPTKSVLIVSSLNIELSKGEPIFPLTQRINKHLNITMCPASNEHLPITFLIPHMLINISSKPFEALWSSLNVKVNREQFDFHEWLKDYRIRFRIIRSTLPYEIIIEKMPLKKVNKQCSLHKRNAPYCDEIPFNYFVLYLDQLI